ncbi:MAG: DUF2326 domain-containing protein [Bacillota bacterium]
MLKEIRCDLFRKPLVTFHEGLNVVLGDHLASNSIGKSTMLMIIDFVFGGDSYVKVNYDAIKNLGHHEFRFKFEFDNDQFYFIRKTDKYKFVYCCNEKYEILHEKSTIDYTTMLKESYKIDLPYISFRSIVSLYSRVWGKDNYDIKKPLHQVGTNGKSAVETIIKLFGKYSGIKSFTEQIDDLSERREAINKAAKKNYLPLITKTIYKQNLREIDELDAEKDMLASDIHAEKTNISDLVTKEILSLKRDRSELLRRKNIYEDRLKRIRNNINKNIGLKSELSRLKEYFSDINIEKLSSIELFHANISGILKKELKNTEQDLMENIELLNEDIEKIDVEIDSKLDVRDAPKYTINRIVELAVRISQLKHANDIYIKKETIEKDIKKAKNDLSEIKATVISEINNSININIYELNQLVNKDGKSSPVMDLKDRGYDFRVFDDTGTGRAYVNLLIFDLAIFKITQLPILVHDTLLFKNVENVAIENIIDIYRRQKKQIFIAVDEINKYNIETKKVLNELSVLQLAHDKTLFIKDWKKTSSETN